jgi:hypothetical protein
MQIDKVSDKKLRQGSARYSFRQVLDWQSSAFYFGKS